MHRNKKLRGYQTFVTDNWLGGIYGSSGVLGTKGGGSMAAAWAVMHHLGNEGYERVTAAARAACLQLAAAVGAMPELTIRAAPQRNAARLRCRRRGRARRVRRCRLTVAPRLVRRSARSSPVAALHGQRRARGQDRGVRHRSPRQHRRGGRARRNAAIKAPTARSSSAAARRTTRDAIVCTCSRRRLAVP